MAKRQNIEKLTANVVASYVQNHQVAVDRLPDLIKQVHQTFLSLNQIQLSNESLDQVPAVSIEESMSDSHMICLEDGMQFRSLKRHLKASHNLSPEQYREKWNLAADYPMVAPNYSLTRSRLAKNSGLGRTDEE